MCGSTKFFDQRHVIDFAPSVYEHCALLIGKSPWEVSRDADLLFEGQAEAYRRYGHKPVVVGVDIYNLEAEAYGAEVDKPDGNGIPAITRHICENLEDVLALPPFDPAVAGRIPLVIEAGQRLKTAFPEADVRIPVSGPFSIATNLVGFENLLYATMVQPEKTCQGLCSLVRGQVRFCENIRQHGLDIAFFESAAAPPLLSPEMFRTIVFPPLKEMIEQAAAVLGHPVPCVIGGDTTPILQYILETGTKYVICPAETDQVAFLSLMRAYPDVMVRVNMDPGIVSRGTWDQIRAEIDRILEITSDREKVCLGTGAVPYETPPENIMMIKRYVSRY